MKLSTKEQARLFAEGFQKGREAGIAHAASASKKALRQLAYVKMRVATLARWRRYAIDRLGVGLQTVGEIDKESKRRAVSASGGAKP